MVDESCVCESGDLPVSIACSDVCASDVSDSLGVISQFGAALHRGYVAELAK